MSIQKYVELLNIQFKTRLRTEHSYHPLLQSLLEALLHGIKVTSEPQRINCSDPNFISPHKLVPIGYIEAKDTGKPLDGRL